MANGNQGRAEVVQERGPGVVAAGTAASEGFGTAGLARTAETSSSALAAQAKANVEARFIVALKRPRSWLAVREAILNECRRPRFAQVARYHKPIGRGVEGPSIRFAEAAMRCMGNLLVETATVFDDAEKRIIRVSVTDLESNLTIPKDVTIDKTVERSQLKDGQTPLNVRTNSRGQRTYIVAATEDDLLNKENALVSKAMRTSALRLLPGDILDEAMDLVIKTQNDEDARDPAAARKNLVDAFSRIHVTTVMLADYLGHSVDQLSPDELAELRALGLAIKDGEAKWSDAIEMRRKDRNGGGDTGKVSPLKERVQEQAKKTAAKKQPPPPPPPVSDQESDGAPPDEWQPEARDPGSDDA